jgi:AP endonuclease-1
MSRRTSRKIDYTELDEEIIETAVVPVSTPKKVRKAVTVVSTEVVTQAEKTTPTKGYKKVKAEADSEEEDTAAPAKSPAKAKVNKVKAKTALEGDPASKPKKAPAKRKAKTEDDDDEEGADDNKVKKKRKTKEEKEAEAMPLPERTAIGALKKAMHIGAHVSAAGGEYSVTLHCPISP